MNEIRALVEGAGMEPHLGFLHRVDYGRPSLALDLLEPFRAPLVDRLTLKLVNERTLTEADFGKRLTGDAVGSVMLVPDSLHKYLEAYEAAVAEPSQRHPRESARFGRPRWRSWRPRSGMAPDSRRICEGDRCST